MIGHTVNLEITDLHDWGYGVGQSADYGRIYVPFAFPGERLDVVLREPIRRGGWLADLAEPKGKNFCIEATRCGGCLWPGIGYAAQLDWKKTLLRRAIKDIPELVALPVNMHGSGKTSGVRNRIHLHANFFNERFEFGFFARGTRKLVPVQDCPMAEEPIRRVLAGLADRRVEIFSVDDDFGFGIELIHLGEEGGKVQMALYASQSRHDALQRALPNFTQISNLLVHIHAPQSPGPLHTWQRPAGFVYYTRPGTFQQGNTEQAAVIRNLIGRELESAPPGVVFDLCSGSGNYSLAHHRLATEIYGVDENRIAIEVAQINIERNQVHNAVFHCGVAAEFLGQRVGRGWPERADTVIVDPARQGMGAGLTHELGRLKPGKIIYISNNTASFVGDARGLIQAGFRPQALHLVDFFPNTPHFDTVTVWGC